MIESIRIRDFRGIQSGVMDRFRRFNLLVGPNNSGKSTLIEALYLANTVGREAVGTVRYRQDREVTYDVRTAEPDLLDDQPMSRVWARHNYPERQRGLTEWSQGFLWVTVPDGALPLTSFALYTGERGFAEGEEQTTALFALDAPEAAEGRDPAGMLAGELMQSNVEPFAAKRLLLCWHRELTYYSRGSAAWLVQGKPATAGHTIFFDAHLIQRHLPMGFYQRILGTVPGWTQRIARSFGRIFEVDKPFGVLFLPLGPDGKWMQGWIAPEDRPALPIDVFGDGARSAFKLLTPLVTLAASATSEAPGLLLWEEPELYQNPKTLKRLFREVIEITKDKPIQVFITTQSLETIGNFTTLLQEGLLDHEALVAFRLDLTDGLLRSSRFEYRNLLAWLTDGLDPRVWEPLVSPIQYRLEEKLP